MMYCQEFASLDKVEGGQAGMGFFVLAQKEHTKDDTGVL